ncbi:MAG: metallophosphoesterase family protein [Pseudomonadota bacterium]
MNHPTIDIGSSAFVFGGAYGNLDATKAILEKAKNLGYRNEQIIFTGDAVAYCGQPAETATLIRNSGVHVIMGNCEEALGEDAADCGCGFEDGTECSLLSVEWYQFCKNALNHDMKRWMRALPKSMIFKIGSHHLEALHGSPDAINDFVFPSDVEVGKLDFSHRDGIDGYIVGHSGIPFLAEVSGKAWINSGAAGMPANDGTPRIWYATIEASGDDLIAVTQSLRYDHRAASTAMENAGLKNGYLQTLSTGVWPSFDVLPEQEKAITGKPLSPQKKVFKKPSALSDVA